MAKTPPFRVLIIPKVTVRNMDTSTIVCIRKGSKTPILGPFGVFDVAKVHFQTPNMPKRVQNDAFVFCLTRIRPSRARARVTIA